MLINARDVMSLVEDLKLLITRRNTSLDASTKKSLDNVINLFATNNHV